MDRPETIRLLRMSHDEIITLRRQVAELSPKAHAYDTLAKVIRLKSEPEQGYGIDIAWELSNAVETLVAERDAEKGTPDAD